MLHAISDKNPLLILDIGCADGFLARELQKRGHTVIGVEGDTEAAEKAKKYCKTVYHTDLNGTLPILKEKFDVVLFGDILEHLLDGKKVLHHFTQFAKKDAQILLSTVNIAHLWIRLNLLCGRFQYEEKGILDKTHTHLYTWKSWRKLAHDNKLTIKKEYAIPVPLPLVWSATAQGKPFFFLHWIGYWVTQCWKKMFAFQMILDCRK